MFFFSYKYLALFSAAVLRMIHIAVILKRQINYNCLYTNRICHWLPETNLANIWLARLLHGFMFWLSGRASLRLIEKEFLSFRVCSELVVFFSSINAGN